MADQTAPPATDDAPPTDQQPHAADTPNPEASAEDVKAMQKALNKANKEAQGYRQRLQEFEDRDKTEAEKLTERAEAAERTASESQQKLLRYEVALEKKLPAELASRLQGGSREEMEADADELLKLVQPAAPPVGGHDGGPRGGSQQPADMNQFIRQAAGRA
jgi:hypothetical protein